MPHKPKIVAEVPEPRQPDPPVVGAFDVWLIIDPVGNYSVGVTKEDAADEYRQSTGFTAGWPLRYIHLPVKASLPRATKMPTIGIPDDELAECQP